MIGRWSAGPAPARPQAPARLRDRQPARLPDGAVRGRHARGWSTAGCVLLLAHAAFKAALFMVVGILDHQTGTRDICELPVLGSGWRPVQIVTVVSAASMAGLPLLAGFVAKEAGYAGAGRAPVSPPVASSSAASSPDRPSPSPTAPASCGHWSAAPRPGWPMRAGPSSRHRRRPRSPSSLRRGSSPSPRSCWAWSRGWPTGSSALPRGRSTRRPNRPTSRSGTGSGCRSCSPWSPSPWGWRCSWPECRWPGCWPWAVGCRAVPMPTSLSCGSSTWWPPGSQASCRTARCRSTRRSSS